MSVLDQVFHDYNEALLQLTHCMSQLVWHQHDPLYPLCFSANRGPNCTQPGYIFQLDIPLHTNAGTDSVSTAWSVYTVCSQDQYIIHKQTRLSWALSAITWGLKLQARDVRGQLRSVPSSQAVDMWKQATVSQHHSESQSTWSASMVQDPLQKDIKGLMRLYATLIKDEVVLLSY